MNVDEKETAGDTAKAFTVINLGKVQRATRQPRVSKQEDIAIPAMTSTRGVAILPTGQVFEAESQSIGK